MHEEFCDVCGEELRWLLTSQYCPNEDKHDEILEAIQKGLDEAILLYLPRSEFIALNDDFHPFSANDRIMIQEFDFSTDQYQCLIMSCKKDSHLVGGPVFIDREELTQYFQPHPGGSFASTRMAPDVFADAAQRNWRLLP